MLAPSIRTFTYSALALGVLACQAPEDSLSNQSGSSLRVDLRAHDADGDGVGGIYDCNEDDAALPAACPQAEPEEGRPVWCDDGLEVPESRSLMNWVNHLEMVDGREKGLREYLYDSAGEDKVPDECGVALMATRGGAQDANTEQLMRYVIEGLEGNTVGYMLGGRSFWPNNAEHWDHPNHAIDTSCPSADGRTRLRELHEACSTAVSLRRISEWDPCGSQYDGHAILVGGGQSADEFPKANLLRALEAAAASGAFGDVKEVIDIDTQHWSNACRAALGGRGCCHVANRAQEQSGHAGVQLIIPTDVLKYGPICKNADDLLHKYECSDLSGHAPLEALGNLLREVLDQPARVRKALKEKASVHDLLAESPLGDDAMLAVLQGDWKDKDILTVLEAQGRLSDRVLLAAVEELDQDNRMAAFFVSQSPLSVDVLLSLISKVKSKHFLAEILKANSPWLNDTVLLAAIETMKNGAQIKEVLFANCPLSPVVVGAAKGLLNSSDHLALEHCHGG